MLDCRCYQFVYPQFSALYRALLHHYNILTLPFTSYPTSSPSLTLIVLLQLIQVLLLLLLLLVALLLHTFSPLFHPLFPFLSSSSSSSSSPLSSCSPLSFSSSVPSSSSSSEMAQAAYSSGADFFYRVNDDTELVDRWPSLFVQALHNLPPPRGAPMPVCVFVCCGCVVWCGVVWCGVGVGFLYRIFSTAPPSSLIM